MVPVIPCDPSLMSMSAKPFVATGLILILCLSCRKEEEKPDPGTLQLISVSVGPRELQPGGENTGMPADMPVVLRFSQAVERESAPDAILLKDHDDQVVESEYNFLDSDRTVSLAPKEELTENTRYTVLIEEGLKGIRGESFPGLEIEFRTLSSPLSVLEVTLDGNVVDPDLRLGDIGLHPEIRLTFSAGIPEGSLGQYTSLMRGAIDYVLDIRAVSDSIYLLYVTQELPDLARFRFNISPVLAEAVDREFEGIQFYFHTQLDSTYKFLVLSDEELLTLVQRQTFKYFWEFGHPVSGLARERNTSLETVTSGGSGFGLMAMVVAMERGFITREEGLQRLRKILDFLETADRFHGAWSHWINGTTGEARPFSAKDNGGDLVETSYLAMGLLTIRQYLEDAVSSEKLLIDRINSLWEGIEWDWYTRGGEDALYWHWSPEFQWEINLKIRGYNEALITYVMAASSPTHGIDSSAYHVTWARNGDIVQNIPYFGINLPLSNQAYGGPLFFAHYSFLGIDPRHLSDRYANYMEQNVNHSLINYHYCRENPADYIGYSADSWGLTASDGPAGYSAHSPTNDRGVITPTAALSSIPYTPGESMRALKHFYYLLGDRLWGEYGFYDAFSPTADWVADSYLAIDQGPIIVMIENYRTQLLWDLFMSAPEVRNGLTKLGFSFPGRK